MENAYDDLFSETDRLEEDTMCLHQLKQDVDHILLQYLIEIIRLQTYSSLLIWLLKEFLYILVRLQTQNHINSAPTLICVSSTTNSLIFIFLKDNLSGLYF
jgi:hypothetical protein